MPLARFDAPFEYPDWIFEPKSDGFRAVVYIEGGACRLVSLNRNAFKTFEPLAQASAQDLSGRSAILDGEILRPGPDGRPMFYELMRRRGPFDGYWSNETGGSHDANQGSRIHVTGASSGIGLSTAIALSDRGSKVALLARSTDPLQELAQTSGQRTGDGRHDAA
jgi:hypothetical protein